MDHADVLFDRSPDGPIRVFLKRETYCVEEGFGSHASTYPATIVKSRYGGTYEGAAWLCFPIGPGRLSEGQWRDWQGDDIDCAEWHGRSLREKWPIGRGPSPDLAYANLIEIAAARAGINLRDWSASPTWDREELKRREGNGEGVPG